MWMRAATPDEKTSESMSASWDASSWDETWTLTHDLALLFVALAYGTDRRLSDDEIDVITRVLEHWNSDVSGEAIREIIVEVMTVLLEEHARTEVRRSIGRLGRALSQEELSRVLTQLHYIAEADGIVLRREEHLIATLAEAWSLRRLEQGDARTETESEWDLLRQMALIYVVVAHSTDNALTPVEIEAILERLRGWKEALDDEAARDVLRDALAFYAQEPGEDVLGRTIRAIKDSLPPMRRLILLDDLYYIAHADGTFTENEREMITSLGAAWGLSVRLNGSASS